MKTEKHGGPPVYNNLPIYVQIFVNSVLHILQEQTAYIQWLRYQSFSICIMFY